MKKILQVTLATVVAAIVLEFARPVVAFASQEGAYLYRQFFHTGPAVFFGASTSYTGSDGVSRNGVTITTGTLTTPAGTVMHFLGAVSAKPSSSSEGDFGWDSTLHTIFFATGTSSGNDKFVRAVTSGTSWTIY